MTIQRRSPAKINLTLDVLGRDENGYHRIQTIYHEVPEFFDKLVFKPHKTLELICDHSDVPHDNSNLILRAAELLKPHAPHQGARITLQKNIPLKSGLGGASSNAATTLLALNELWSLHLTQQELLNLAAKLGMDVPFFIIGGTALGEHYGEQITPLPPLNLRIKIISTNIQIPTQAAYTAINLEKCGHRFSDTQKLLQILKTHPKTQSNLDLRSFLHNDFEFNFFEQNPALRSQYPDAHLTGTGGCLYTIFF